MHAGSQLRVCIKHGVSREERLSAAGVSCTNALLPTRQIFFCRVFICRPQL